MIAWADEIIRDDPSPPVFAYALSLTKPELSSVREVLRPVALSADPPNVIDAVLGLAARDMTTGRRSIDDTLRVLTQLRRFIKLRPGLEEEIKALEHQHMLAVAGVTDRLEQTRVRVAAFLSRFVDLPAPTNARHGHSRG